MSENIKCLCCKYLLIEKIVLYEIKVKKKEKNNMKTVFSFLARYSELLKKHKNIKKKIDPLSDKLKNFPIFPPKTYCKKQDITTLTRRKHLLTKYFQNIVEIFQIKDLKIFQNLFAVNSLSLNQIFFSNQYNLPYFPLDSFRNSIQLEEMSILLESDHLNPNPITRSNLNLMKETQSILQDNRKREKILKISEDMTFIVFLDERLGKGAYGEVYKGVCSTKEEEIYAIKEITIPAQYSDNYKAIIDTTHNEINILKSINHENIVKYIDSFENSKNIYLIMELCNDGNLESFILHNQLSEKDIISLFKQIISGFIYLHNHKILHRDVKPSNLLLNNNKVKISDFGFARVILNEDFTTSHWGTYPYMAPQILQGKPYNNMSDIWSLGITFYFMLFKKIPWDSKNPFQLEKEIKNKLKEGKLFTNEQKNRISLHAQDLLLRMIVYDENLRITWDKLFDHPLFKEKILFGLDADIDSQELLNNSKIHARSEFLKKVYKRSNNHQNIKDENNETQPCFFPYCGDLGKHEHDDDDNKSNMMAFKEINPLINDLGHYNIKAPEEIVIETRKKNKSSNFSRKPISHDEQLSPQQKKNNIEELKTFQRQYSTKKSENYEQKVFFICLIYLFFYRQKKKKTHKTIFIQ